MKLIKYILVAYLNMNSFIKKEYFQAKPNLLFQIIQAHPDKPWDWDYISENPNITMEMINAHPDKPWNWGYLSFNKFSYNDIVYKRLLSLDIQERERLNLYYQII